MSEIEAGADQASGSWGLMSQIPVRLSVEIGSVSKTIDELRGLAPGAVVELDRSIDDAIDILANGTVIARGEVVRAGDRFGVRVTGLVDGDPAAARRERRS